MNNLGREKAGGGCAACGRLESFGWPRCLLRCWWRDLAEFGRFYSRPAADEGQSYGPHAVGMPKQQVELTSEGLTVTEDLISSVSSGESYNGVD
jgi:hypothetical protein